MLLWSLAHFSIVKNISLSLVTGATSAMLIT